MLDGIGASPAFSRPQSGNTSSGQGNEQPPAHAAAQSSQEARAASGQEARAIPAAAADAQPPTQAHALSAPAIQAMATASATSITTAGTSMGAMAPPAGLASFAGPAVAPGVQPGPVAAASGFGETLQPDGTLDATDPANRGSQVDTEI
ncbi:hypothetical protein [Thioalkalivibrio sp. ALJ16]|uniref:hypothetical protein n=1 Tax=Thioalkalivibrio sp. ALJ16 TaxID=1158762 RepID=UPI0003712007|nr:hypothetical protein [Thioalkalivibrio sp. ALJ16]